MAAGLMLTRLAGLVRERMVAYYLGASELTDVLYTSLRGSNLVQNLLGEQALSAGFIPAYSRLLAAGRERDAGRFAGAILGLLIAAAAGLAALGVALAPLLVAVFTPGFRGDAALVAAGARTHDRYLLAVDAVQILFPAAAVLVVSAWCLAVLNSHRRFFLSYCAPVVWNAAIIGALAFAGWRASGPVPLLRAACYGALVGAFAQLLLQLPAVSSLLRGFSLRFGGREPEVREALRAFVPALLGRGVVQLSSWLEFVLASFLAQPGPTAIALAQRLYALPIALFGGAVAAAELPELARARARSGAGLLAARDLPPDARLTVGLASLAHWVVPAAIGALVLGLPAVTLVFQTGRFDRSDGVLVALVLAGFAFGMAPSAASRLLQNAFYALGNTGLPARVAAQRLAVTMVAAVPAMWLCERFLAAEMLGLASRHRLGAVGIAFAASLAGWWEFLVLWRAVRRDYPAARLPGREAARAACASTAGAAAGVGCWRVFDGSLPAPLWAGATVAVYGAVTLAVAVALARLAARRTTAGPGA